MKRFSRQTIMKKKTNQDNDSDNEKLANVNSLDVVFIHFYC